MDMKAFIHGLVLACFMVFLAGCATTSEEPAPEPVETVEEAPPVVEETVELDSYESLDTVFYFDFDMSILKAGARAALTAHAERLSDSDDSIRLEGHADERGTREYNMALGERRANAVRDFLILNGISASRVETVSYGEEYPAVVGSYESAWEKNRRVELK